eukprot:1833448-Rhodomonas_salina.2
MAKRVFGKLAFYTLADGVGTIQLYLEQEAINKAGPEAFDDLKVPLRLPRANLQPTQTFLEPTPPVLSLLTYLQPPSLPLTP